MSETPERIPGPAYRIVTARLVVRCYHPTDAPALIQAVTESKAHLLPFMPWAASAPEPLQVIVERLRVRRGEFDLGRDFVYGIFLTDESRLIGSCGLHTRVGPGAREIGYWLHKDYTGRGLATECAAALTRVAFEIDGVQRVEVHMDPRNERSAAVPRRLGFTYEAVLRRRAQDADGTPRDTMFWSLLASEYPASPSAQAEIQAFDAAGRRIL